MSQSKQQYGQYMTPFQVCNFMVEQICHKKTASVLEPCCGQGAFLEALENHGFGNVTAYEIDSSIINPKYDVINKSFVSSDTEAKYDVIIGNPPYIRWKNLEESLKQELTENSLWNQNCNSLCDYSSIFILKSIEQLKEDGELIFITPEYWLSTTHAMKMRNFMLENGYISHIYYFNETPIFKDATVSLVVFRFVKSQQKKQKVFVSKLYSKSKRKLFEKDLQQVFNFQSKEVESFYINQFEKDSRWILADEETQKLMEDFEKGCGKSAGCEYKKFGDYFYIGNGMVSGLDKAFQLGTDVSLNEKEQNATIQVVKAKDIQQYKAIKKTDYIFLNLIEGLNPEILERDYPEFKRKLSLYKDALINRYSYKRIIPYWEWTFLRNFNLFSSEQDRIYVPCKERITKRQRFRFCFAESKTFPTQDVTALFKKEGTRESLYYVLALLNSRYVFNWLSFKGVRKGDIIEFSEKPVSSIPYRCIDFENEEEVGIHDEISEMVKQCILNERGKESLLEKIDCLLERLM